MKLTIIHPCIGRRPGQKYIRTWQMEPLPAATLAGLTPADVQIAFYDDRMENIPFDEPADLVAISVETLAGNDDQRHDFLEVGDLLPQGLQFRRRNMALQFVLLPKHEV